MWLNKTRLFLTIFALKMSVNFVNCEETENGKECSNEISCGEDPDVYLNAAQIIRRHGYTSESHVIQTKDGYILTLHRIPKSKNGTIGQQPIFLQHGLLASSTCWLVSGNKSLAFILSDLGYDVWMGNARGNDYSRAHAWLTPNDPKFWNFSWHEMAIFDIPAAINYVAQTTNKAGDILYVGHSMGTTMFFAFASLMPDAAENVRAMVALAPVTYMTHLSSPIRYLAPLVGDIDFIRKHLGFNEFLPSNKLLKLLAVDCGKYTKKICENVLFVIVGFDKDEVDDTTADVALSHMPSSTSTKTMLHYLQEIKANGNFEQYDYGKVGNMIEYGQETPPEYKLQDVKVPVYLMYADADKLTNPIDVKRLYPQLQNKIGIYEVPLPGFDHVDFLFAKDVIKLVYNNLTATLKAFSMRNPTIILN